MDAYRFESAFDGEPQGLGLFYSLYEMGLNDKQATRIEAMFSCIAPPILSENAEFYFTELGILQSYKAILHTIKVMEKRNWGLLLKQIQCDPKQDGVVYMDNWQIAFKPGVYANTPANPISKDGLMQIVDQLRKE